MSGASFGRIEIEIDGDGPPIVFLHGLGRHRVRSSRSCRLCTVFAASEPISGRRAIGWLVRSVTIDFLCETARDMVKGIAVARACRRAFDGNPGGAASGRRRVRVGGDHSPLWPDRRARRRRARTLRDRAALARRSGMIAIADPVAAAGLASSTKADNPAVEAFVRRAIFARTRRVSRNPAKLGVGERRGPPAPKLPYPHRDRRRRSYRPARRGTGACGEDQGAQAQDAADVGIGRRSSSQRNVGDLASEHLGRTLRRNIRHAWTEPAMKERAYG